MKVGCVNACWKNPLLALGGDWNQQADIHSHALAGGGYPGP